MVFVVPPILALITFPIVWVLSMANWPPYDGARHFIIAALATFLVYTGSVLLLLPF